MRYVASILLAGVCCSCSTAPIARPVAGPVPAPKAAAVIAAVPDHRGAIILTIHTRDKVIAVRAGDAGPTYSLLTARGEVLMPDMTLGELARKDPEMFQKVQGMQADSLWAGAYIANDQ